VAASWSDDFGLACCAIEMIAFFDRAVDIARFGRRYFGRAAAFGSDDRLGDVTLKDGSGGERFIRPDARAEVG